MCWNLVSPQGNIKKKTTTIPVPAHSRQVSHTYSQTQQLPALYSANETGPRITNLDSVSRINSLPFFLQTATAVPVFLTLSRQVSLAYQQPPSDREEFWVPSVYPQVCPYSMKVGNYLSVSVTNLFQVSFYR